MSNGNIIVSTLTNRVEWDVDRTSYGKALKAVKSLKAAHEKPAKALEAAQKRASQSEGKAALAAAKAQTAKLRQAKQISAEQQKQAQLSAKVAQQEQAHAKRMAAINARGAVQQINQADQLAKQNERLARISAKVRAAARSRSMTYNPSMGGTAPEPGLLAAQTAAMNRGHASIANDIIQTKKAIALEEKRQREKEAGLKRQSTAYDTLRRASLTISHIEGASLADKMKAVQAIKEATKGYAEQRYTIAEMRHELAKATLETRRQARLNRQIVKDKAKAERAGRINAERLTRERKERGYGGLTTAGVNVTITAPLHVYSSTITSQDWQGKRQPGTNRQMTAEDVVASHTLKHYLQTRRDVEYAMAQSLLHNTVEATHLREGPTIHWDQFWGINQPSTVVKTGTSANVITEMQNAVTLLKKNLGGWSSSIKQVYLLASPSLFTAIQGNPTAYQAALFGATSRDIIFPDTLGAYDRYNIGRVTVVQVDDPLYNITEGTGFMLATFSNIVEGDLSPYMTYMTPASRHAEVANGPVYPSYHYVLRDKFMNYEVVSELSQIQIPMRPDFVLKVTMDDAA